MTLRSSRPLAERTASQRYCLVLADALSNESRFTRVKEFIFEITSLFPLLLCG